MCYYRCYIFLGCGHSTHSPTPVRYCANARSKTADHIDRGRHKERDSARLSAATTALNTPSTTLDTETRSHSQGTNSSTQSWQTAEHALPEDPDSVEMVKLKAKPKAIHEELEPCSEKWGHPLHRIRLERLCAICQHSKDERLRALESSTNEVHIEPSRWSWKYKGGNASRLPKTQLQLLGGNQSKGTPSITNSAWGIGTGWLKDWKLKEDI